MESRCKDSTREHITRETVFFMLKGILKILKILKNVQFVTFVWHEIGEI